MNATWFDRLARDVARGMSRREAIRLVAGSTAMAVFGSWLWPSRGLRTPSGLTQDSGCKDIRTFYRPDCKNPVPKQNFKAPINGCGPEGGVFGSGINAVPNSPLYLANFEPACNTHDVGYSTCNRPQDVTDRQFYHDMYGICGTTYPGSGMFDTILRIQCKNAAGNYHKAVSTLGKDAHQAGQAGACDCCEECQGGGAKCGTPDMPRVDGAAYGTCCKNSEICEHGACCEPCLPGWTKCPDQHHPPCLYSCCDPRAPVCDPWPSAGCRRR